MLIFIALSLISLILRLINLGGFPANISAAELSFIYPLRHLLNYNLFLARLPFVLFYTLALSLTVILVKKLSFRAGFWTGVLLVFSPWHLSLSRRAQLPWQPWLSLDVSKFLERLLDFLSPRYLFLTGDQTFGLTANSGLLLSITLVTLLIALTTIKQLDRLFWMAIKLILFGTALASLQVYFGNTQALVLALFGWTILLGWGIAQTLHKFPWLLFIFMPIFAYQAFNSVHNYLIHSQKLSQSQWEVIYEPLAKYLVDHQAEYQRIVVISKYGYPKEYLDWYSRGRIDQSRLVIDQFKDDYLKLNTLYIGHINEEIKHQVLETFKLPTGSTILFAGSGPSQAK